MKLEDLEKEAPSDKLEPIHKTGGFQLSLIKGGRCHRFFKSAVTGEIQRWYFDPCRTQQEYRDGVAHGLGAVCD